jgi:hypothetical protein
MEPIVNAAKCKQCGALSYPTHFYCPQCNATEFEPVPIAGEGTLLTYTRSYALPLDYEDLYLTLGIVQLDQGIRATGRLKIENPETGMRVRATVGVVRDIGGKKINGLIFVPA